MLNSASASPAVNANVLPTPLTTSSSPQRRHDATNSRRAGTQSTTQALNSTASEAPPSSEQPETHALTLVSTRNALQASGQSYSRDSTPMTPSPGPTPEPVRTTTLQSPTSSGLDAPARVLAASSAPQSSTQATIESAALAQYREPPAQSGSGTSSVRNTSGQNTTESGSPKTSVSTPSQRNPPSPFSQQSAETIQQVPTASAQVSASPPAKNRVKIPDFFKRRK